MRGDAGGSELAGEREFEAQREQRDEYREKERKRGDREPDKETERQRERDRQWETQTEKEKARGSASPCAPTNVRPQPDNFSCEVQLHIVLDPSVVEVVDVDAVEALLASCPDSAAAAGPGGQLPLHLVRPKQCPFNA